MPPLLRAERATPLNTRIKREQSGSNYSKDWFRHPEGNYGLQKLFCSSVMMHIAELLEKKKRGQRDAIFCLNDV